MRIVNVTIGCLIAVVLLASAKASDIPEILIVEVQTGSNESASQEFVELFNAGSRAVSVDGWQLEYLSASGSSWLRKSELAGKIEPRGRYLIAAADYFTDTSDEVMSSGLAGGGGHVRVSVASEAEEPVVSDTVGWGDASQPETQAAVAPSSGQSLKRVLNEDGYFIDSDDNSYDFFVSDNPSPRSDFLAPAQGGHNNGGSGSNSGGGSGGSGKKDDKAKSNPDFSHDPGTEAGSKSYQKIQISELLPDPDKPALDAEDEFVEIFNPNKTAVNLKDYKIQTGMTFSYSFTLPAYVLKPGQYLAVYAIDSGLTLSNTAGQAQILDPNGTILHKSDPYQDADPNQAWALIKGKWQWTNQLTPNQANAAGVGGDAAGGTDPSTATTSDALGATEFSHNPSFDSSEGEDGRNHYKEPESDALNGLSNSVLAGLGGLAVLYAGYEYRHDISNRVHQFKRYLARRRQGGGTA